MKKTIKSLIIMINAMIAICVLGALAGVTEIMGVGSRMFSLTWVLGAIIIVTTLVGSIQITSHSAPAQNDGSKEQSADKRLASLLEIEDHKAAGPVAFLKMRAGEYKWLNGEVNGPLVDEEGMLFLMADTKSFVFKDEHKREIVVLIPKQMPLVRFVVRRSRKGLFKFGFLLEKPEESGRFIFRIRPPHVKWMCPGLLSIGALYTAVKTYAARVYPIDDNVIQPLMRAMIITGAEKTPERGDVAIKEGCSYAKA